MNQGFPKRIIPKAAMVSNPFTLGSILDDRLAMPSEKLNIKDLRTTQIAFFDHDCIPLDMA
jgi:hypothetical protein